MKNFFKSKLMASLAALLLASIVSHAQPAQSSAFYSPPYRGASSSESAYWNQSFTNANGVNAAVSPAPGGAMPAAASVSQTTPGAVLSAGHIYSFATTNTFTLNYAVSQPPRFPNGVGAVVFQAETAGRELDYSSVKLKYGQNSLTAVRRELYRGSASMGSSDVVSEWEWPVPVVDDVTNFSIAFNASNTSLSLERVMLDVAAAGSPAQTFSVQSSPADVAQWMYPFNPGDFPDAPVFAAFGYTGAFGESEGGVF
jgi:hypothetical protein